MRYYIQANLDVRLKSSCLLPGSLDFHIGAILTDETTANLYGSCDPSRWISSKAFDDWMKALPGGSG